MHFVRRLGDEGMLSLDEGEQATLVAITFVAVVVLALFLEEWHCQKKEKKREES